MTNDVCVCPEGFHGINCQLPMSIKCIVNLTEPDTSMKDCPVIDTDEYLHSLGGFRPCFFYDFEQVYEWRFKLDCRSMTASGLRMIDKQALGYEYLNVLVPPTNVETGQSKI